MKLSLNEINALARKATRGAGFTWGLAAESGRATAWLAARQLPGPDLLVRCLRDHDRAPVSTLTPHRVDDIAHSPWRGETRPLCPVVVGPALCDRAAQLQSGTTIEFAHTCYPLLMVPFLAFAARLVKANFLARWDGSEIVCASDGNATLIDDRTLAIDETVSMTFEAAKIPVDVANHNALTVFFEATVADEVYDCLDRIAHRTYAPESDQSRLAGAGAGLTDND